VASVAVMDVNAFNRLLKPAGKRNPSPMEDGIHDPTIDSTRALLAPQTAYADLPKSQAGNRINWVEALNSGKINPRWDRSDPKAEPVVMDLNIVREVKGSMPDVVYPHKQHTQWLDCSNCHPAIFIPQKGANAISMAAILLGEKCGVCHGKVAFPVSECRLCHSKKKDFAYPATASSAEPKLPGECLETSCDDCGVDLWPGCSAGAEPIGRTQQCGNPAACGQARYWIGEFQFGVG